MFDKPPPIVGSGIFMCQPLVFQAAVPITSPFLKPSAPIEPARSETGPEADRYAQHLIGKRTVFPFSELVLRQYAEKLVEVSRIMKELSYDIILCPLRGARMPGLQADLVCKSEHFQGFDGTDMAKRLNDDRILDYLRGLFREKWPRSDERRIGVLDTAIGGDSCREFARLLRSLNDEDRERWLVHFHLLHDAARQPDRASTAYSYGSKRLQIEIRYHPVIRLLFEDEPKLLGYDVQRGAGQSQMVRFQQEGQVLVYSPGSATLYRPAPLDETIIALVSREIMNFILSAPDINPVHLD